MVIFALWMPRRAVISCCLRSGRRSDGAWLSGRSAAWLARLVRDQEVEGSNPFAPTISFKTGNLRTDL